MLKKTFILFTGILLFYAPLNAGTSGKISGKITDRETGDPLPGANIVVVGTSRGAAAGINGTFTILDVSPGIYTLKASFIGYRNVEVQNVRVTVDLTTNQNFEMPSQAIEGEDVIIIAERPLIDPNATNEVHVKRAEDIENMPIRGYQNIVATEAGVVQVGNNLHIRGSRAEEVAYYVDGVYINNAFTLARTGDVINNSIEEISFQAGGFGAEYGSANAGVINTTTKIGGSSFKIGGEAFTDEFLSTDDENFGAYSYGQNLLTLSLSGPLTGEKVRLYIAGEFSNADDRNPTSAPHAKINSIEFTTDTTDYRMSPLHIKNFPGDSIRQSIVTTPIAESVIAERAFGPRPLNSRERFNFNGNILFDLKPIRFRIGGSFTDVSNRNWVSRRDLFNNDRNSRTEVHTITSFLQMTHQLSQNTLYKLQFSYFKDDNKIGDDLLWEDFENYGDKTDWNGDGIFNSSLRADGFNQKTENHFALFRPKGAVFDEYRNTISSYVGLTAEFKSQRNEHEIMVGGDIRRNTVEFYRLAIPMQLAASFANNPDSIGISGFEQRLYQSVYAENIGFNFKGGDNNILERDEARKPINAAFYIRDKVELEDLVLNIGIRWDYLQPNTDRFQRPDSIILEGGKIADTYKDGSVQLIEGATHSLFSPRIGLAFPVSDRTVFHAQWGKYFQQPELNRLFVSYTRFANNLTAGNFTRSANPALKPEKQTQYEVGFQQQIGQSASLDITGFYREMRDYVQIRNQINLAGAGYALYVNGDYGTVKGTTFSLDLRRTSNVAGSASYTFQFASGTGSTADGQFRAAWQNGFFPTYVSPLDFDQRHTGSINLDYRLPKGEGPGLLQRAGVNFLYTFGSGRRYTPARPTSAIFPSNVDIPTAGFNTGTMPFFSQLDMRVNKLFNVGGLNLDAYVWVKNLFDSKKVTNIYNGTGEPDNDGYFGTPAGIAFEETSPNGAELYRLRIDSPDNFGPPRQIFLGVKFEL